MTIASFEMHFLVIGGTGRNGSLVVEEALSRGHSVTALVRNLASARQALPSSPNLTLVEGLPACEPDLVEALTTPRPPSAIVTALAQRRTGESPFAAADPSTPADFMSAAMQALLAAISRAALPLPPKLVVNSSMGAGESWAAMNLPAKLLFKHSTMRVGLADHNELDSMVRRSGLAFVLSRPCMLAEGPAKPVKVFPDCGKGCAWMPTITRASVGPWLVDAAETSQWDGTAPVITN